MKVCSNGPSHVTKMATMPILLAFLCSGSFMDGHGACKANFKQIKLMLT